MADVAVENNETPTIEKPSAELEKEVADEVSADKNGEAAKENGAEVKPDAEAEAAAETPAADVVAEGEKSSADSDENGTGQEASKDENDSSDTAPADAVKRKITETEVKPDESAPTPEKKAKLDESLKEDAQNGSEATEAAA